jgi:hypothetical protein
MVSRRAFLAAAVGGTLRAGEQSPVMLESSDRRLAAGFDWAKKQALGYVRRGDPVGDWYEASLAGRNAFCMRDVSHQSAGAQVLGLGAVTRNMLHKFAENVAASRDWCSYWEIDRLNRPAPVDYKNDRDFWYNLPANFDILHCCFRQYLWTGDAAYLTDPAFVNFYDKTVNEYVRAWDKDGDGVPESYQEYGHRGIGSYAEDSNFHVLVGADLVAAQAAAYADYAAIQELKGRGPVAREFRQKAQKLKDWYNSRWWDAGRRRFYRAMRQDRSFSANRNGAIPELWFGITEAGIKTERSLDALEGDNVEVRSYFPEIAYRYGRDEWAYARLMELTDPGLKRREYPEVSFAVVGAVAEGLMGIRPDARRRVLETCAHLTGETEWAALGPVPVFDSEIRVSHKGARETTVTNLRGPGIEWRARFRTRRRGLQVRLGPGETKTLREP